MQIPIPRSSKRSRSHSLHLLQVLLPPELPSQEEERCKGSEESEEERVGAGVSAVEEKEGVDGFGDCGDGGGEGIQERNLTAGKGWSRREEEDKG